MSVHKLVAERLPGELQLYNWRNKGFGDTSTESHKTGVHESIPKMILRLQIYTNRIKIRPELQAAFKK